MRDYFSNNTGSDMINNKNSHSIIHMLRTLYA